MCLMSQMALEWEVKGLGVIVGYENNAVVRLIGVGF